MATARGAKPKNAKDMAATESAATAREPSLSVHVAGRGERLEVGLPLVLPGCDGAHHFIGIEDGALQQQHLLQRFGRRVIARVVERELAARDRKRRTRCDAS